VAGFIFVPWIIVRSAAFNARYSAFRNMTFHFDGKYQDALKVIYMGGFIPVVVTGMTFNWWTNLAQKGLFPIVFLLYLVGLIFYPGWKRQIQSFLIGHTSYGSKSGELSATGVQFFKVYLKAWLLMVLVLIITGILGSVLAAIFRSTINSPLPLVFIFVPIYIGYVLFYAYLQSRSRNLVWTHTRIGPIRCQSMLSAWDMAKLYLTNTIGIVFSLGMLTPWAVMRMLKYRFEKLRVQLEGNLSEFKGSETSAVQAVGAEMQEFFDLDFSL